MRKISYLVAVSLAVSIVSSCGSKKAEMLQKDWKATELKLGETALSAEDIGGVYFSFKPDSSFTYTEPGNTQTGKWSYSEEGNSIELTYQEGGQKVIQAVQELTPEKLVLNYEEHGMKRSISLVPDKK